MAAGNRRPRHRHPAEPADDVPAGRTAPALARWLAHLVLNIGTWPDSGGITFGSLADGISHAYRGLSITARHAY